MGFQFSDAFRNAALDAGETAAGTSPILRIRTGSPPANCAAARSGTVLASMNLPSDWLAAASGGIKALSGTWQDTSADAAGIASHFEIMNSAATVCHLQGRVSSAWAASSALLLDQQVHSGGNVYRVTAAGTTGATAPNHTSGSAANGTATLAFVQSGTELEIQNTNIASGQSISVTAFMLTAGGA